MDGEMEDHVLVVDDDIEVLDLFRLIGRRLGPPLGARFTLESDPEVAFQLVRDHSFALIVADYVMPRVDGLRIVLEARIRSPSTHAILMTRRARIPEAANRLRDARIDAYLSKPVLQPEAMLLLSGFIGGDIRIMEGARRAARAAENALPRSATPPARSVERELPARDGRDLNLT